MNGQLVEIASWRIVSELSRRYPGKFKVIETHPGGGQYDCLSLYAKKQKHIAAFNRVGRLHIFENFDGSQQERPLDIWRDMMESYNPKETLDKISGLIGLPIPGKLPSSTPTTLVYRFIAEFLTHAAFGNHDWECRSGYEDTSGYGGGVRSYFKKFPQARERLRIGLPDDFLEEPAYRFWFLCRENQPVLCLETNGMVWTEKGKAYILTDLYASKRKVWPMIQEIAGDLLP